MTILTTCWAGFSAPETSAPSARVLDLLDEGPDHRQRDVGLEQGDPDLAGGGVDVRLGEAALAPEVLERGCEAVGESVEHGGRGSLAASGCSTVVALQGIRPRPGTVVHLPVGPVLSAQPACTAAATSARPRSGGQRLRPPESVT